MNIRESNTFVDFDVVFLLLCSLLVACEKSSQRSRGEHVEIVHGMTVKTEHAKQHTTHSHAQNTTYSSSCFAMLLRPTLLKAFGRY